MYDWKEQTKRQLNMELCLDKASYVTNPRGRCWFICNTRDLQLGPTLVTCFAKHLLAIASSEI